MRLPEDCARSFRPERLLGRGGFGEVYQCEQLALARKAAVKVLREELARDPATRERFTREAQVAAALAHPHVVAVLDHGAADTPWIAFELVSGATLRERLDRGPMDAGDAVDMALQIASALEVAHARGIVHRDLKPENLMESQPGHWKLADFGIAHLALEGQGLTNPGMVLGTPAYLDPEYVASGAVTPHVDVYALAVTLYEAVTGARPFDGDTAAAVLTSQLSVVPPRAAERQPGLSRRLDEVLAKALAKRAADRYPGAVALRAALEQARAEAAGPSAQPAPMRSASAPARTLELRRGADRAKVSRTVVSAVDAPAPRARGGALAAAVALVGLGALAGAWSAGPRRAPPGPSPTAAAPAPRLDPARAQAIQASLFRLRKRIVMARLATRTERFQGVGEAIVANTHEVEPLAADALDAFERHVKLLQEERAPAGAWGWAALAGCDTVEVLRYFPRHARDQAPIARRLKSIEGRCVEVEKDQPIFAALVRAGAGSVQRTPSAEQAGMAASELAIALSEREPAGWASPADRLAFRIFVGHRELLHEMRMQRYLVRRGEQSDVRVRITLRELADARALEPLVTPATYGTGEPVTALGLALGAAADVLELRYATGAQRAEAVAAGDLIDRALARVDSTVDDDVRSMRVRWSRARARRVDSGSGRE